MTTTLRIGIIGGGIGGIALARALQRQGIDFRLFERSSAFSEIGAGVQMTPNAVKALKALGVEDGLRQTGFLPEAMVGRNWQTAEELFRTPLKGTSVNAYGAEFFHIHRSDLHAILCDGLDSNLVTLGTQCTGVAQTDSSAIAFFEDGSTFEADLIVAADGIHSAVRKSIWGDEKPLFTGHMCWRALVPVAQHPLPFVNPDAAFWMGPKAHVVTYYVKGGAAVNIVAVAETNEWVKESWTERSSTEDLLDAYQGWHPDLTKLFSCTEPGQTYKWGLFDRDPMARWSEGRVTLLGDAAHPMLPFLSQGAAMAIEDSYVLAQALKHYDCDVKLALQAYEKERQPRTSQIQLQARERGKTYHLSSAEDLRKRDQAYKEAQAKNSNAVGIRAEWIYEYDATSCRERFES
ncbi:FAD-dependent monooxygenase [Pseudomonas veronii]|uniref:FAD-dependent monooxygenase n=1 Tax=Pseudomonas veronii TaxID=76761 RepID=UPI002D76811D|nr:FAD-dependent monooxygenase [Pseudomonas veronii]WRU61161.1 FAD-dependent monooxygenase [Pseudomonas veronii]